MAKANQSPPFRAKSTPRSSSLIIVVVISILSVMVTSAEESIISDHDELKLVIAALRSHNYSLFANAIETSDLSYSLSTSKDASFTLFAPPDPYLFSLDMASSSRDYIGAIDLHIVHGRLSFAALQESDYLETLLPRHHLYVVKHEVKSEYDGGTIIVAGVPISAPGLFLGFSIAVHGLDEMIASEIRPDEADLVQRWCSYASQPYLDSNVNSRLVIGGGDEMLLDSIMSHGHFSKFRTTAI